MHIDLQQKSQMMTTTNHVFATIEKRLSKKKEPNVDSFATKITTYSNNYNNNHVLHAF
jgi:hypothetical protein